tara:strand:+ start:1086 stop:1274 length:189 start_codon:yes stop_codon:yes gene_type:complete
MYKERFKLNYLAKREIHANTLPVPKDYYYNTYKTLNARFRTQNMSEFINIIIFISVKLRSKI